MRAPGQLESVWWFSTIFYMNNWSFCVKMTINCVYYIEKNYPDNEAKFKYETVRM